MYLIKVFAGLTLDFKVMNLVITILTQNVVISDRNRSCRLTGDEIRQCFRIDTLPTYVSLGTNGKLYILIGNTFVCQIVFNARCLNT